MKLKLLHAPVRNQYLTVFIANLITFTHGSVAGWLSPALLILNSTDTPLLSGPMTPEQISWLASSICLGGTIGVIVSGAITARFGNRIGLICLAIPHFIWWGYVIFGDHYLQLVIGRTIVGFTGGALFRVIPSFVSEVAQSDIRGTLGSMSPLLYNLGMLLGFTLGEYVPYEMIPFSGLLSLSYLLCIIFFVPETPSFLMSRGKVESAYRSLLFYRTVNPNIDVPQKVQDEFADLKMMHEFLKQDDQVSWKAFFTKQGRFGLSMAIFLASLVQFSGGFTLTQFTATIFLRAGSSLAPNDAAIVVVVFQIIGCYSSVLLADHFGRKSLLLASCFGTAASLGTLGLYAYLEETGIDVVQYNWVPIVSFSAAFFLISIGIAGVPFTILAEILPAEIKGTGLTMAMAINTTFGFCILKVFPLLLAVIQVHGIMWLFAMACLIGMIVSAIFLPETKGKNLNKV